MAIEKTTKEILRGGVSMVGNGFDVAGFETGGGNVGSVSAAISAATIFGLTSSITVTEELEFEISDFDGSPGRTKFDSTPRKADLKIEITLKQITSELFEEVYTTLKNEIGAAGPNYDKVTRTLDPDGYTYKDNVFVIGKRKDKKMFILVIDSGASESALALAFTDGEDVTHVTEIMAHYDMDTIKDNLDGAIEAPYKLYIEKE